MFGTVFITLSVRGHEAPGLVKSIRNSTEKSYSSSHSWREMFDQEMGLGPSIKLKLALLVILVPVGFSFQF